MTSDLPQDLLHSLLHHYPRTTMGLATAAIAEVAVFICKAVF